MQQQSHQDTTYTLNKKNIDPNPFQQFDRWFREAIDSVPNLPEAMVLATADKQGRTSARTVLLKQFDENGFVFYTNYESLKGTVLEVNPNASLVFHWRELERQVCITGKAQKVSRQESASYFHARPRQSQISVHASKQSQIVKNRQEIEENFAHFTQEFEGEEVPLPPYWGGYRLVPHTIEFWLNQRNRMHDRLRYTRQNNSQWLLQRLSP
jgi:pyridoxamine 5'-phosphate oxidase